MWADWAGIFAIPERKVRHGRLIFLWHVSAGLWLTVGVQLSIPTTTGLCTLQMKMSLTSSAMECSWFWKPSLLNKWTYIKHQLSSGAPTCKLTTTHNTSMISSNLAYASHINSNMTAIFAPHHHKGHKLPSVVSATGRRQGCT